MLWVCACPSSQVTSSNYTTAVLILPCCVATYMSKVQSKVSSD